MHSCRCDSITSSLNDFNACRADTTCINTSGVSASASIILSRPSIWPLIFLKRTTRDLLSRPARIDFDLIGNLGTLTSRHHREPQRDMGGRGIWQCDFCQDFKPTEI